jgi:hypothetical protein
VRVVLKKIDGVRDANVSLKEGVATIVFTPENRVKIAQIWKGVRDNGFTPRGATIRAAGVIAVRGDSVVITVSGSEDTLLTRDAVDAPGRVAELAKLGSGARVVITGQLPEAPSKPGELQLTLAIKSFLPR